MHVVEPSVSRVRIAFRRDQVAVCAGVRFRAGDEILVVRGRIAPAPSRFSVQIGVAEHVVPEDETGLSVVATHYPWRFLNHSCAPTAALRGRRLLASCEIAAGDEVTFDYETTEWEMAAPFACGCGQPECRGRIAGYRHLDAARRQRLAAMVAPHLLAMLRVDA